MQRCRQLGGLIAVAQQLDQPLHALDLRAVKARDDAGILGESARTSHARTAVVAEMKALEALRSDLVDQLKGAPPDCTP
jgi:hypothetical protein